MLKTYWRVVTRIERLADNLIIIICFFLAYHFRNPLLELLNQFLLPLSSEPRELASIGDYYLVLGVALPLYNAFLSILGAYNSMRFVRARKIFYKAFAASALVFLCQGSILYLLKLDLSRSFIGIYCLLCGTAISLERWIVLQALRYYRARGFNFRNILLVGTGQQAKKLAQEIMNAPELGARIVGFVALEEETALAQSRVMNASPFSVTQTALRATGDLSVVATGESFEAALKKYAIDEVLFTDIVEHFSKVQAMARIAAEEGVRVTLAADLFNFGLRKSDTSFLGRTPLIHYHAAPGDSSALVVKRMLDLIISAGLLLLLSPLMLLVAIGIKLESPGPVFFRQRRVGLNGRIFTLLKFRSMVQNAEALRAGLEKMNEMNGPAFKIKADPRVTRLGHFIRRFSIDELPQLINVLRGDMSLVGPRPPLPEEVSLYLRKYRRRLSMRPGLTCTWQVSGRNQIPDFEKWVQLDLDYIDNWSIPKDLLLLLRTIPAILSASGR